MRKQLIRHENSEIGLIRANWEATPDVLSVKEVGAGHGARGKYASGIILVGRGKATKALALNLQEKALAHIPDLEALSVLVTATDHKQIEFALYAGEPWQERIYRR